MFDTNDSKESNRDLSAFILLSKPEIVVLARFVLPGRLNFIQSLL